MPVFQYGFRENPSTEDYRHPQLNGGPTGLDSVSVTSLFSGCGGLDIGFLGGFRYKSETYPPLPFRVLGAYDNDPRAIETYRLNISNDAYVADLTKVDISSLPAADVLLGGFPCQDFSSSGPKLGLDGERGRLYQVMSEYMKIHRPLVVVGENVPHLAKLKKGAMLAEILDEFESSGYDFRVWTLSCPDYGLPQNRTRLFLVGVRSDLPGEPIKPQPRFQVRHRPIEWAIEDLVTVSDEQVPNQSQYFVATRATAGAGQGDQDNVRGQVAYCIRANAKARIHFHYELDRRLTVRECARLQSFPDEFVFPFSAMTNMVHIGNAVPPIVAHQVAESIAAYVQSIRSGDGLVGSRRRRPAQMALATAD